MVPNKRIFILLVINRNKMLLKNTKNTKKANNKISQVTSEM